jgi:hypothetical protein
MPQKDCEGREPSIKNILSCAWPAILLATVCLLPYLNKAFHTDDPWFLIMARQIIHHPLHPSNFEICWNTAANCFMVYTALTPGILMGYALTPTVLAGSTEWMGHLTQLLFVWIAVLALCSLVLRLGYGRRHAMAAALFLVTIPPLLPLASTVMPDVLGAALGTIGFERLAAWKSARKWGQAIAAGFALGLAGVARTHLVLLVPLAAFFLFDSIRLREMLTELRDRPWRWTPIPIAACVLMGILFLTREQSLVHPVGIFLGRTYLARNLRTYPLFYCFPLPLAACWAAARWSDGRRRLAIVLCAGAVAGIAARDLRMVLPVIGLGVLGEILWDAYRRRDHMQMFLGLWLLVPLPIIYYGHFPIKYLLPCMPAVILMCLRLAGSIPRRLARVCSVLLIIGGTVYTILILHSDVEFGEFGRTAMERLVRTHSRAGEKVWVPSHYSAYWYGARAGAEVMTNDRRPQPGDLLAVGRFEGGASTLEKFPRRTLVDAFEFNYSFGRTMGGGIGLYTNASGSTWLWGFGSSDQDRYELWRID